MKQILPRNHPVCAKLLLPYQPASLIHMAQLFNLTPDLLHILHHVLLQDSSANPRSTKNQWSPLTATALLLTHDPPSCTSKKAKRSSTKTLYKEILQVLQQSQANSASGSNACTPTNSMPEAIEEIGPTCCQKVILLLQLTNIYLST